MKNRKDDEFEREERAATEYVLGTFIFAFFVLAMIFLLIAFIGLLKQPAVEAASERPTYTYPTVEPTYTKEELALGVDYGDEKPYIDFLFEYNYPVCEDVPLPGWLQIAIQEKCDEYCVSYPLIIAMIDCECRFQEEWDGNIIGPMQVNINYHSKRAENIGVDIYDTLGNIATGIDYLAELLQIYKGDPQTAVMWYNGGSNKEAYARYVMKKEVYWSEVIYGK